MRMVRVGMTKRKVENEVNEETVHDGVVEMNWEVHFKGRVK